MKKEKCKNLQNLLYSIISQTFPLKEVTVLGELNVLKSHCKTFTSVFIFKSPL